MRRSTMIPVLLAAAVFAGGCATAYRVRTNGYLDRSHPGAGIPAGASFAVLANPSAPNPLFEEEVRRKIEALLVSHGFRLADAAQADHFVAYQYEISSRSQVESYPDYRTSLIQSVYVSGSNRYTVVSPGYTFATYETRTRTVYVSRLFLKVLAGPEMREQKEKAVWVGEATAENENPDLRDSVQYLLAAVFRVFGQDTGRSRTLQIGAGDPDVAPSGPPS